MCAFRSLILAAVIALTTTAAPAAEVIMFRRDGCPWCVVWDREIGPIYGKSDLGRRAPIRLVDLDRDRDSVALTRPVRYTPTFVLVEHGREVSRIEGYPGADFFWGLLEGMMRRLPMPASNGLSAIPPPAQHENVNAPASQDEIPRS
jgi:hypothetical protein